MIKKRSIFKKTIRFSIIEKFKKAIGILQYFKMNKLYLLNKD